MDDELYQGSISAIPQNRFLGGMANFMKFLEQEKPEFLPKQLDAMGLIRQLSLPSSSTVENLSYGNSPFTMPPQGTGAMIPQVKTGRKAEVADLVGLITGGVPGTKALADSGVKISQDVMNSYMKMLREANAPGGVSFGAFVPTGSVPTPQKSDLGFYSALEQATIPLQSKGTGTQFLAQLEKTPGVKPEEIKFTGLDQFLRNRETVTKPEIQQFLDQNRVDLQEVRLGEVSSPYPYRTADEWQGAINRAESAGNWDEAANINQAWEAMEGFGPAGATKFSKYTLPGGENYREILLKLPNQWEKPRALQQANSARIKELREQMLGTSGSNEIRAEISRLNNENQLLQQQINDAPIYKSSHFDQPNILAHMRVNDRVVDGKKTLFIEEVQSDWHQAGRKKGYATGEKAELPEGTKVFEPGAADSPGQTNQAFTVQIPRSVNGRSLFYGTTREEALANAQSFIAQPSLGAVPDAPFKTTWHELTLKRAIQEASEKGYDKIAFTTGQTQAARYDLSKQVDSLLYTKNPDGTYSVSAQVQGRGQMLGEAIPESNLSDYVGKEVAEKMAKGIGEQTKVAGKYDPVSMTSSTKVMTQLSGDGLKVGGEGMKGFYDQILPKSLEKLGKKFDAKVGKTTMDGTEVWSMDITPKMRESVTTKGQPLFQFAPAVPAAGLLDYEE